MDLSQIRELLKIVAESGVAEVEIEENDFKLVVRKQAPSVSVQPAAPPGYGYGPYFPPYPPAPFPGQAAPPPPSAPVQESAAAAPAPAPPPPAAEAPARAANEVEVKAPIVGTFYRAPSPDADAFVNEGDEVKPGDPICIIEAMKLMNEIECEVKGTIKKVLVENGQPVEYDQPLFIIQTA